MCDDDIGGISLLLLSSYKKWSLRYAIPAEIF